MIKDGKKLKNIYLLKMATALGKMLLVLRCSYIPREDVKNPQVYWLKVADLVGKIAEQLKI